MIMTLIWEVDSSYEALLMKNETTTKAEATTTFTLLLAIYISVVLFNLFRCCEICCNTSPKYRGWYCFVNDFNRLAFYNIFAVFADPGVSSVPLLKINVNVVITNGLPMTVRMVVVIGGGGGGGGGGERFGLFPHRQSKLFWFQYDFRNNS